MVLQMPELSLLVIRGEDLITLGRIYSAFGLYFKVQKHGSGPEHYSARMGAAVLEIHPRVAGSFGPSTLRLGFTVENVDAALHGALSAGAELVKLDMRPDQSGGGPHAILRDPEGTIIELTAKS